MCFWQSDQELMSESVNILAEKGVGKWEKWVLSLKQNRTVYIMMSDAEMIVI